MKSLCHEVALEFFPMNAPDTHKGTQTHVLLHFVKFGCIWDRFATALNSVQNGPNWCNKCKSSCHEVVSELFAKNSPDTPRGTLNSCFVAFRNVWVQMGQSSAINAKVRVTKSCMNLSLRTCLIHTIGP